ncbi:MAG: DUF1697 domain-containing protein [Candidatus Acidiferrales bacterium]
MPVIVSMLRGVNVLGHNQIKMDALRALYESLKFTGCQTYINSGNVVFCTSERDLAALPARIEKALNANSDFAPASFTAPPPNFATSSREIRSPSAATSNQANCSSAFLQAIRTKKRSQKFAP